MVRRTKTTIWWKEPLKPISDKYNQKWIEGPRGKLWVGSVYYDTGGFTAMAFGNENREEPVIKIMVSELEEKYRVLP